VASFSADDPAQPWKEKDDTMTRVRVERILCDNPDCVVYVDELALEEPSGIEVELIEHVVAIGWTQIDGSDFCPDHS
jgi:hypothetical protein